MLNVNINPFKVKEFILQLETMTNKLHEISIYTSENLNNLQEHWNDDNYLEFKTEWKTLNERIVEDIFLIEEKSENLRQVVNIIMNAFYKPLI